MFEDDDVNEFANKIEEFISICNEVRGLVQDSRQGFKVNEELGMTAESLSVLYDDLDHDLPDCFSTLYLELGGERGEWVTTDLDLVDSALEEADEFLDELEQD